MLVLIVVRIEGDQNTKRKMVPFQPLPLSLYLLRAIKVHEGRIVACFDIPGSYLHAYCSDKGEKFMLLEGHLAEVMVLVEPKMYCEYVTYSPSGGPNALCKDEKGPIWHVRISASILQAADEEIGG